MLRWARDALAMWYVRMTNKSAWMQQTVIPAECNRKWISHAFA
jgi:hypothetical protein